MAASSPPAARKDRDRAALLAELRARIRALEGWGGPGRPGALPLGLPAVDAALPAGGLPLGCVHEIGGDVAATAFAALLLARLAARTPAPLLWLGRGPDLYPPGLAGFGLTPDRLILAHAGREADRLWALEEAARTPALAAALGEVEGAGLTAGRRLQLAAEAGGVTVLLLRRDAGRAWPAGTAVTRWRVAARPGRAPGEPGLGPPCWRLELLRCRGGRTGAWDVAWDGGALRPDGDEAAAPFEPGRGPAAAVS